MSQSSKSTSITNSYSSYLESWRRLLAMMGRSARSSAWPLAMLAVLLWYLGAMFLADLTAGRMHSPDEIAWIAQGELEEKKAAQAAFAEKECYLLIEDLTSDALDAVRAEDSFASIRTLITSSQLSPEEKQSRLNRLNALVPVEMNIFEAGWRFKMQALAKCFAGDCYGAKADFQYFTAWLATIPQFVALYWGWTFLIYLIFGLAMVRVAAESLCHDARLSWRSGLGYALKNASTLIFAFVQVGIALFVINLLPLILLGLHRVFPGGVMQGIMAILSPILLVASLLTVVIIVINKLAGGLMMPAAVISRTGGYETLSFAYKHVLTQFWRTMSLYVMLAVQHVLFLVMVVVITGLTLLVLAAFTQVLAGSDANCPVKMACQLAESGVMTGSGFAGMIWQWLVGLFMACMAGMLLTHLTYGFTAIYMLLREQSDQIPFGEVVWMSHKDAKRNAGSGGDSTVNAPPESTESPETQASEG